MSIASAEVAHVGDSESDSDGPPDLGWTHDSDPGLHPSSKSKNERESPTPLGDSEPEDLLDKAIARNSTRQTL